MEIKLYEAERKLMEVLWREGDTTAKRLAEIMGEQIGWSKTTTYTMVKRCIDKGVVERRELNYVCHPLISREEVQESETTELINRMFGGAADQLVASILGRKTLTSEEIERLKLLVGTLE